MSSQRSSPGRPFSGIAVSAKIEEELSRLDEEERRHFWRI